MIYGIGHDVVEIERMRKMVNGASGDRLMKRVLTPAERELPGSKTRPAEFLAGRFAAKEAVSKAFGCGIGKKLGFQDMSILPDQSGKPHVILKPEAWERLDLGAGSTGYTVHLSITHERQLASAFVIVEKVESVE
ncbi:holo-ACP synthase [Paenibacillus lentus]|uniref:Holo-[acyl-carrier-protein] synthase n=1 Tax=Paenibacillus lentus TaxID=1338368 RepID=A0A3Q8S3C3_9BACL|nr:holo-ACP synthase [Paenibacillus lentus]AZK44840.1 holo-ACP synthase [Paenibacillus lentus]